MRCLFPSGPWENWKRFRCHVTKTVVEEWQGESPLPVLNVIRKVTNLDLHMKCSINFHYKKNISIDKDLMLGFSMKMDAESSPTWYPKQAFFNGWKWWNNQFLCNDLESSNWNNHKKLLVWSSRKRFVCNPWVRWCWLLILQYNCWNTCTGKLIPKFWGLY